MTVRFILGRSGSGKTHRCLQQIRRALQADPAGPPLILLAPEQATFQLEQALLANGGLEGYHRARVVSFLRLAHLVLQQTAPPALEPLSESGKQMILRRLLQEHQDQLVLFGRSARSSGFIAQLGGMISEMRQYRKTPDDLIRQAERLRRRADTADAAYASLVDKLTDLALIYQAYREAIAGRFLDPDEFLDRLADCCGGAEIFRGAHLWLDGFAGFTGQQYHVLEAVLQRVADAHICLCLDPGSRGFRQADAWDGEPGRLDEMDLFHPTLETYLRLKRLIQNASLIVAESIVLPEGQGVDVTMPRFHRAGQLARLEAGLYADNRLDSSASESPAASELSDSLESLELPESSESLPSGPPASPEDAIGMQEVVLVETARRRSEVEAAARHILRLCRRGGYRFGQIAVILRDFGPYQELLETIFTDYGIAFFLDQRRPIRHHPCVELVRSALAALQTAFRTEHVLRYLKTDLAGIDRRAADRLENYALAHGIEHDRWWLERPWQPESAASSGPADSDRPDAGTDPISSEGSLDDYRRRAIDPLRAMRDELFESADQIPKAGPTAETATVRRISAALFGLLERLGVPRTLRQWQQEAQGCHDLESFQAHRQVYEALIEVLEELVESLGDVSVSLEQYAEILNTALSRMTLALIPPALDQVLIGTIERSRHPAVRAVFLLGLNEGVFPRNPSEDSLLSDPQRELLEESGFTLADSGTRKLLHESYLGYIALTRPSEFLWLSYPVADEKANELAPSPLLDAVRSALGSLPFVRLTDPDDPDLSRVTTVPQFAEQLARACAQNPAPLDASFRQVWSFVAGRAEWRPILQRSLAGLTYRNQAALSPAGVRRLFGAELTSSISRLESFAACPFQHFARYLLRLEERSLLQLAAVDLGAYYHQVLSVLFDLMQAEDLRWPDLTDDVIDRIVAQAAAQVGRRDHQVAALLDQSQRNRVLIGQAAEWLKRFCRTLRHAARIGAFRQAGAEWTFGEAGRLGPLVLELDGGRRLILQGKIDRFDLCPADRGRLGLCVIDYKSSGRRFSFSDFHHGLSLQLVGYLLALQALYRPAAGGALEAAAAVYLPIQPAGQSRNGPPPESLLDDRTAAEPAPRKARGIVSQSYLDRLDGTIEPGKRSQCYSFGLKKDGSPTDFSRSDVVAAEQMEAVLRYCRGQFERMARHILAGRIEVSPYRIGQRNRACNVCSFQGVCRFDPARDAYRDLPALSKPEALARIEQYLSIHGQ